MISDAEDGARRACLGFRLVAYPTPIGCAAAYYPEMNQLVPLDSTAIGSNCPTSKSVVIRLEPADPGRPSLVASTSTGRPVGSDDHHKSPVQPHHLS